MQYTEFPKEGFDKCIICGEKTQGGAFCKKCWNEHSTDEKLKILNEKQAEKEKLSNPNDLTCIICGKPSNGKLQCRDCYYEMLDYKESLNKNAKLFELKDYYFNLRSNIYRMKTYDYVLANCNKLVAIAYVVKDVHQDNSLVDRLSDDIREIVLKKKPKQTMVQFETCDNKDGQKEEIIRTKDGHRVKSDPECVIDDLLYGLRIVHCYEKKVPIEQDEQSIYCDWFIPVDGDRRGIYIEYWGMSSQQYLINKERKKETYKKYNIPLIQIEKEDYRDIQGLENRVISEINELAKRYFNIDKFLKI